MLGSNSATRIGIARPWGSIRRRSLGVSDVQSPVTTDSEHHGGRYRPGRRIKGVGAQQGVKPDACRQRRQGHLRRSWRLP